MATAISDKLVGACYLFFLKSDTEAGPITALRQTILNSYEPRKSEEETFSLELNEARTESYFAKAGRASRLEWRRQALGNVIGISLGDFIPSEDGPDWSGQIELLNRCETTLQSQGIDILGAAVVGVGDLHDAVATFDNYKEAIGEPSDHMTAKLKGNIIHQFMGDPNRQFFFLENKIGADISDMVMEELPRVVWVMHRLAREKAFFQDRLQTILSEKQQIDEELSRIFHQKVGLSLNDDSAKLLEEQITRLSSMYSMMATDLHLVSEAADTFDRDLSGLEEKATEFDADDSEAFPRYRLAVFYNYLKELRKRETDLRLSLNNTKAAIDIAQIQAEILRGSQGLVLQEQTRELLNQNVILEDERASVQAAASVVELVVLFYYALGSWKVVMPHTAVEELPSLVKFGVVGLFSISMVTLTHYVGASLHKKKIKWVPILISLSLALVSLVAMGLLPGLNQGVAH
jgi:hypothetical protein